MTYYVLSGRLNTTHSVTDSVVLSGDKCAVANPHQLRENAKFTVYRQPGRVMLGM